MIRAFKRRFKKPPVMFLHDQGYKPEPLYPRFAWLPVVIEDGYPETFGFRWLRWYHVRWFEGHYSDYWRPIGMRW